MKFETRLTDELDARYRRSGHWGSETFYSILAARAAAHPDRVALVDRGRRVTYAEVKSRVDRVSAGFAAIGTRTALNCSSIVVRNCRILRNCCRGRASRRAGFTWRARPHSLVRRSRL